MDNIEKEILELREKINKADYAYYVLSSPIMSDSEYDKLFNRLLELENSYPQYKTPDSPTQRIGSDIDNTLPERNHSIPVLSLDKCYSIASLYDWYKKNVEKINNDIELIIEPKIDGAGVVLYYEDGILKYALTRGNGYSGNDITENIKTIRSVPLRINYNKNLAVRGEVYINKEDFKEFNEKYADGIYSNPRNLASGAVRRLKSKEAALFPLNIFCYEGYFEDIIDTHLENIIRLKELDFPVNNYLGYFSNNIKYQSLPFDNFTIGNIRDIENFIEYFAKKRESLKYEIDGLVIKINDLKTREILGETSHHPRWAIAYKFDAPLAETKVISIEIQIGRAGRVTPVANLEPVELSGSTISRATLHNMEYVNALGINAGDTVTISKRGDVIPAVEEVIDKGVNSSTFVMPERCPSCGEKLIKEGAHHFCLNEECPARLLGTLQYFVGRGQMDIETLGDKTLEFLFNKGFIRKIYDIYEFDYYKLLDFEGFKEKKIENIIKSVEESKKKDFKTILYSLGLKDIGPKVAELLANNFKNIDNIIKFCNEKDIFGNPNKEKFSSIYGIGDTIAESIIKHFSNPKTIDLIERLRKNGLSFELREENKIESEQFLKGTKWVITGSFSNFKPREKAAFLIKQFGGEVVDAVSSKVNFLLKGEEPGSKLNKAKALGIKIIDEAQFVKIINSKTL